MKTKIDLYETGSQQNHSHADKTLAFKSLASRARFITIEIVHLQILSDTAIFTPASDNVLTI